MKKVISMSLFTSVIAIIIMTAMLFTAAVILNPAVAGAEDYNVVEYDGVVVASRKVLHEGELMWLVDVKIGEPDSVFSYYDDESHSVGAKCYVSFADGGIRGIEFPTPTENTIWAIVAVVVILLAFVVAPIWATTKC